MNGIQNPRMGGTWHSTYNVGDRQKIIQILAATLKEIQNPAYNEQKALAMAQDFEKYTFSKSGSKEEYLNIIKQKVSQLRMSMRNTSAASSAMSSNGNVVPNGSNNSNGTTISSSNTPHPGFQGQNMAMYTQNHQQQGQQPQQQMHQRQASVNNPQTQQQNSQGIQLTQQQIQQIGQIIRTNPIPPALLSKLPNLPPNVNTWARIYECLQKKIIPTTALPLIKEVHNAHYQLAVRQHQQQKLTQLRRANGGNMIDNVSTQGTGLDSFGVNGLGNNQSALNGMTPNMTAAKSKLDMNGAVSKNMASMNTMANLGNVGNINMSNMNNVGNAGNMNTMNNPGNLGMNNMGAMNGMNNVGNMSGMNNMNNMNNMSNISNMNAAMSGGNVMGSMGVNRPGQTNSMNQSSPQMVNQASLRGNQPQNTQSQPSQSLQANIGMQNLSQSAPLHQQQQQHPQAKPPNFQITSQDLVKYSADAMALLQKLQQNGSVQPNMDAAQKQSFVRKFISHQKLNAWKAQQKGLTSASVGQLDQHQQMQQQQQLNQSQGGVNNLSHQLHQQPVQTTGSHFQLQSPSLQQLGQPVANQMLGQGIPSSGQQRSNSAQTAGIDSSGGMNNLQQKRATPGSMASVMPALTDEMKMKLRALYEEVSRNTVQLKDVTMLLSDKEKLELKENMEKITSQYSNIDSILSYYYVLTRNTEGTKRLIQMKNMTKNIFDNLKMGIYVAGPDLLEKIRVQYQKHFDYIKEELTRRRAQQARNQPQNQPLSAPIQSQSQQSRPMNSFPSQQFASHGAMQQPMSQSLNGMGQGAMAGQVQHQQYARNNANGSVQQQRAGPNGIAVQAVSSSPAVSNASPPSQNPSKGNTKSKKQAAPRKKSVKGGNAVPTPAASATTPATLANAIKTPNSISTPQIPTSQSAKGTPNSGSPQGNGKIASNPEVSASTGDIFGASSVDKKLMRRRELSKSDPEQFFFAALSNMLKLDQRLIGEEGPRDSEPKKGMRSPLSPSGPNAWTSDVKAQAITSAFRQVEFIAELTGCDVLQECADLAVRDLEEKDSEIKIKSKREAEDDEDMDMLFEDKKFKVDDDIGKRLFAPIEIDDWKSWLGGLQST